MDDALMRIVATAAMRSSRELSDVLPLIKDHFPSDVYDMLGKGIARTLAELNVNVLNPLFALAPQIEEEFERNMEAFGRTS